MNFRQWLANKQINAVLFEYTKLLSKDIILSKSPGSCQDHRFEARISKVLLSCCYTEKAPRLKPIEVRWSVVVLGSNKGGRLDSAFS